MDPQFKSLLTSGLLAAATMAATWGVSHGWIPSGDATGIENAIVTLALGVGGGLVAWWKSRQLSQKAMIEQVNRADNGVKVVAAGTGGMEVDGPLKEAGK